MLSPEEAQKLANLQQRMLLNVREGKAPHDGIEDKELKEGLAFIAQGKTLAAAAGAKKKVAKAKAVAAPITDAKFSKFASMDLD